MSDTILVRFTGICTHLLREVGGETPYRVVLVRAEKETLINKHLIPPHIPRLRIDPKDIVEHDPELWGLEQLDDGLWRMHGVHLKLDGIAAEKFTRHFDPFDIPHLRSPSDRLGNRKDDVVEHEHAACYFDIDAGRLTSHKPKKAVIAELTATVAGAPKLRITRFGDQKASTITLRPGATIDIEHTGSPTEGETEYDFLLHYLIFDFIPDDVYVPVEEKLNLPPRDRNDLSAGCSNSQYP
ncbi:MAG: hypothetical protein ACJ74H_15810 [Thermoanaerobaculia bacterium]